MSGLLLETRCSGFAPDLTGYGVAAAASGMFFYPWMVPETSPGGSLEIGGLAGNLSGGIAGGFSGRLSGGLAGSLGGVDSSVDQGDADHD